MEILRFIIFYGNGQEVGGITSTEKEKENEGER